MALLNIALTVHWVNSMGIVGAALATCIACVLEDGIIMNWYYHKRIGINIPHFWKNILQMCPLMVITGTAAWFVLDRVGINNWMEFFVYAVAYTVVYFIAAYFVMMNSYERETLTAPFLKVIRKIRRKK
jgi:O-antigen/teichoic acid export membrane protein